MEIFRCPNENAHVALAPLLSSAVSSWGGSITDKANGTAQIVDYVRVYQKKADAENPELVLYNQEVTPADDGSGIAPAFYKNQVIDETTYADEIVMLPKLTGNWSPTSAAPAHPGGRHWVTDEKGATSEFKLDDIKAGKYRVFFWRLPGGSNKPQENLSLIKKDGTESVIGSVALIAPTNMESIAGWIEIAPEVTLEPGDIIRTTCNGLYTRVSGLKLVPVK
ncbi:MAG: hypothetical protein IJE10_04205 [Clostridia bacterium]|nr:hypothetical protein [Clostridia bacterium]